MCIRDRGIEAQTLANLYMAVEADLELLPVVNKIDLPAASPEDVAEEIESVTGFPAEDVIAISAKMGTNIAAVLEAVVQKIPPPSGDRNAPFRALVFDSHYDSYKGVIAYVRVFEGALSHRQPVKMMSNDVVVEPIEIGIFSPDVYKRQGLSFVIPRHWKSVGVLCSLTLLVSFLAGLVGSFWAR